MGETENMSIHMGNKSCMYVLLTRSYNPYYHMLNNILELGYFLLISNNFKSLKQA